MARVLFLYGYALSTEDAVARVIAELSQGLQAQGVEVEIRGIRPDQLVEPGGSPVERVTRAWREISFLLKCSAAAINDPRRYDAIVAVDVPGGIHLPGKIARILSGGQTLDVAWCMDLYRLIDSGRDASFLTRLRGRVELWSLRQASRVLVIGECMSARLAAAGIRSTVVPIWHQVMEGHSPVPHQGPLRLLYSGSARAIHPLGNLVRAVAIAERRIPLELRICGRGEEFRAAQRLSRSLGLSSITFSAPVPADELSELFGWADLHVVSLDPLATGLSVPSKTYAAMSCGRGVLYLGSAQGQAAQDILRARCGCVIDPPEERALAEAIMGLSERRAVLNELGLSAQAFQRSQRSLSALMPTWLHELGVERAKE